MPIHPAATLLPSPPLGLASRAQAQAKGATSAKLVTRPVPPSMARFAQRLNITRSPGLHRWASTAPEGSNAAITQPRLALVADLAALQLLYRSLGAATLRRRFHCAFKGLSDQRIHELAAQAGQHGTHLQTWVVEGAQSSSEQPDRDHTAPKILAHGGWLADTLGRAEFALVVADGHQGQGRGTQLMQALIRSAALAGQRELHARVLLDNPAMLGLLRRLGLRVSPCPVDKGLVQVQVDVMAWLSEQPATAARHHKAVWA